MDGKELKKIRQSLDLNQEEFAISLGVTRPYINALENNKREITEDFIKRLKKIQDIKSQIKINEEARKEIEEICRLVNANPGIMREILTTIIRETDLMSYAAKAINGDNKAREKFLRLTE